MYIEKCGEYAYWYYGKEKLKKVQVIGSFELSGVENKRPEIREKIFTFFYSYSIHQKVELSSKSLWSTVS